MSWVDLSNAGGGWIFLQLDDLVLSNITHPTSVILGLNTITLAQDTSLFALDGLLHVGAVNAGETLIRASSLRRPMAPRSSLAP